jgi:hypothetical protein
MSEAQRRKLYDTHIGDVVACVSLDAAWRDMLLHAADGVRIAVDPGSLFREGIRLAIQKNRLGFAAFKDSDPEFGECFCVESTEFTDIQMRSVAVDRIDCLADVSAVESEEYDLDGRITQFQATQIATRFLRSNGYTIGPANHKESMGAAKPNLHFCGCVWHEDHWSVLFAPLNSEAAPPDDIPLTLVAHA